MVYQDFSTKGRFCNAPGTKRGLHREARRHFGIDNDQKNLLSPSTQISIWCKNNEPKAHNTE